MLSPPQGLFQEEYLHTVPPQGPALGGGEG